MRKSDPLFNHATKLDLLNTRDELIDEIEDKGTKFRNDIFTRLDDVMRQLEIIRINQDFQINYSNKVKKHIDVHDKRLKKLESIQL